MWRGELGRRWGYKEARGGEQDCSVCLGSAPLLSSCPPQVLIALVAGEDAERFESLPDHVVLAKALAVLRSIFGDKAVPEVSEGCVQREDDLHIDA